MRTIQTICFINPLLRVFSAGAARAVPLLTTASRRSTLLLALLMVFATLAWAQHGSTLEGKVIDPDGAAVQGAATAIYARGSGVKLRATSDEQGEFRFTGVIPGDYLLEVQAEGFAGVTAEGIRLEPGVTVRRDIRLEIARLRTAVVVTASSTPLMIEEVAKATDAVGAEEISLRDEFSVAEALRLTPGFRVKRLRGPGSLTTMHVRGLRSYDTSLLLDGLRVRDAADPQGSANALWGDLMVVAPERIEVLRGSGSSLYGSHAIAGVVNVVTDQGGGEPHGEVLAEGGGLGMMRGLARAAGGAFGNWLQYSGGVSHINVTEGLDSANPYRNTSAHGYTRYFFTPSASLSGRALVSDAWVRLADAPFVSPAVQANHPASGIVPGVPLPDSQVRLLEQGSPYQAGRATFVPSINDPDYSGSNSSYNLASIFSHQASPALSYRAAYQFLDSNRRFNDGPGGQQWEPLYNNESTFDGRIHLLQGRADIRAGRYNLISGGYEFEDEEYDSFNTDENPDAASRTFDRATLRQRSHSLFVQDQISLLGRNLQVALSGRMQRFDLQDPRFVGGASPYRGIPVDTPKSAWTGDAAVSYMLRGSGTKLRAHAGNA